MEIRKIEIEKIKPANYNPRKNLKPGDPEYEKLKRSIQEFGYVEPIIWNKKTGNIVGGHQRFKVLKSLGHKEVECVVLDIDEQREKLLNMALNKIEGSWDEEKLQELLKDMEAEDLDITLAGFDIEEIMESVTDPPQKIEIKPYDKYHILLTCEISRAPELMEEIKKLSEKEWVEIEGAAN